MDVFGKAFSKKPKKKNSAKVIGLNGNNFSKN